MQLFKEQVDLIEDCMLDYLTWKIEERILELYLKDVKYEINIQNFQMRHQVLSSAALATLVNEALLNMIKTIINH